MIRFAVIDADDTRLAALAPRLRGIALEAGPTLACDAAVFFEPRGPEIERFLQADKPVLACAAASMSKEELRALADSRAWLVNPDRYLPSRQLIRQHLDAGKLGAPGLIRIHRWASADQPGARLCDLDLALWYFGQIPNVVYAIADQIHLGFPGGGMALHDHARLPAGAGYHSLSIIGSSGAAYADDHQNTQLAFRGGLPQAIRADEGIVQWAALVQDFVDRDCKRAAADSDWQAVLAVADAVDESLRTHRAIVPKGGR